MGKDEMCNGNCGMHLCGKCAPWQILFGLLFILAGMGVFNTWNNVINGWTILGLYLLLWGASTMMMKK